MMRIILLTIFGCLFFGAATAHRRPEMPAAAASRQEASSAGEDEPQGALMWLPDPVYDFGGVPRKGGDVAHDFVFRNDGDRPLVVLRVVTSCSCVKASFPKRPVAPGQTGVIRITYEPHKSEPGAFNKVIQVYSNSAGGRDLITVQGQSIDEPQKLKIKREKLKLKN